MVVASHHARHWLAEARVIYALAWPLILTNFAYVALTTLDIAFLGALGPTELAAGGLALALFNQLRAMGNGLVTGISNLVASVATETQTTALQPILRSGLALSTLAGLLFMVLALMLEQPLIWLGQDPKVAAQTVAFLSFAAPGLLPCMWFETLRHFTAGLKQPGPLLLITLLSIALSAFLNYALAFGKLGCPALGLKGVAITTAVVPLVSFFMLVVVVKKRPLLAQHISFTLWKADKKTLLAVWHLGLPIAATYGSEAGFFSVLSLLIGSLSMSALAAQTVVNQVIYIVFMISSGISAAVSINISEACGQADFLRVRRLGYTGLGLGVAAMLAMAIPCVLMPNTIISLFMRVSQADSAAAMQMAVGGLYIAALLQIFDCSQNVANGILRGAGDTVAPFKLSLVGYWLIGLPTAYLLGVTLQYGVYGVWSGLTLGLAATAILLLRAFASRLQHLQSSHTGTTTATSAAC